MATKKQTPTADSEDDPAMIRVRELWQQKRQGGMTMQQLGELMKYPQVSARKNVSQFFKGHDPRVSTLRRFAEAIGISPAELFKEGKKR